MSRSHARSKKSRPKKVLAKRDLIRSSRSPVTRSYTQPYRQYRANDMDLEKEIEKIEGVAGFVALNELEEIKKDFDTINRNHANIENMIKIAERWRQDNPDNLPDAIRSIKEVLLWQARLINTLVDKIR